MLVLSRKINETVVIGDGPDAIELMVVDVRGGRVRLGVKAPREVSIRRAEIDRIPPKAPLDGQGGRRKAG